VSLHLTYRVKHKVLLDKRRSVVRRSFSLWAPGQPNAEYSPSVLNIKEEVVKGLEVPCQNTFKDQLGTWVVRIELENKPLPEELLQCLFEEVSSTAEVVGENRNDLQHLFVIWCVSVKDPEKTGQSDC